MKDMKPLLLAVATCAVIVFGVACSAPVIQSPSNEPGTSAPDDSSPNTSAPKKFAVVKSDAEWRKLLSPEAYDVLRHEGTETAYSSPLEHNHETGIFYCAGCGTPLFSSDAKFDSGTGWPSFFKPISKKAIFTRKDSSLGMDRDEVVCSTCGGHLGHVFDDGPKPTGLRYCMNGVALKFKKGPAELKKSSDGKTATAP